MNYPPHDIADDEPLHRRILRDQIIPESGELSSAAFRNPELSVDRGRYRTNAESLTGCAEMGLAEFEAITARNIGLQVVEDPILSNQAHALVKGAGSRSNAKKLARSARVIVAPPTQEQVR